VLGDANIDRKAARHEATRREILDAAWDLVRAEGLAALSLRELATRVGMRAPSLYAYFASKAAIYDAMFAEGYEELLRRREALDHGEGPRAALIAAATDFAAFCTEDPARYQLLFQRTIPGFEPSPDAYQPAVRALALARDGLVTAGIDAPASLDLWTALLTGLVDQQISNDPGGDRWTRLIPDAVDMFLAHHGRHA
jgi:AcrR family transcriptional regulator